MTKKQRHTPEQIISKPREAEVKLAKGTAIGQVCKDLGVTELGLRSLKAEMRMEMLRTKSPALVRKEVAAHLLAYHLIPGLMAEAARGAGMEPRTLSFKGRG